MPAALEATPAEAPTVQMRLPAQAEALTVVRQALTAVAWRLAMEEERLDDIKVAVTEACTNVVLHAYGPAGGSMDVSIWPRGEGLVVAVRDEGAGMAPRVQRLSPGLGLGLQMIATLSSDMRISSSPDAGTEVLMTFAHAERV